MSQDIITQMVEEDLKRMQAWDLDRKIEKSKATIKEFVDHFGLENVAVSTSGGKDSQVMLHMIRSMYPDVRAVFSDTLIEFPEVRKIALTSDDVSVTRAKDRQKDIYQEFGYAIISKEQSQYLAYLLRKTTKKMALYRLGVRLKDGEYTTTNSYAVSKKYIHLVDQEFTPFKVSDACCRKLKKEPIKRYKKEHKKETGNETHMFVGTMAEESTLRKNSWIRNGCNVFREDKNVSQSRPLSVWTEADVWGYIKIYDLDVAEVYMKGYERTGCYNCGFGVHLEDVKVRQGKLELNRFERLKNTHPKLYHNSVWGSISLALPLAYTNVEIRNDEEYQKLREETQVKVKEWYDNAPENLLKVLSQIEDRCGWSFTEEEKNAVLDRYTPNRIKKLKTENLSLFDKQIG